MQIPIPQRGARGSPFTDVRHGSFAISMAAATLTSSVTCTGRPFTVMEKTSFIDLPGRLRRSVEIDHAAKPLSSEQFSTLRTILYIREPN
jgi:hypothetical protein